MIQFSLVLPFIHCDRSWVALVNGVSKSLSRELDSDSAWEQHFGLSVHGLLSPRSRFRLVRWVGCTHCVRMDMYDPSISEQFRVNLVLDPASTKSLARQLFPQFFAARNIIDEYFDSMPYAEHLTESDDDGDEGYSGDIFVHVTSLISPTARLELVQGDLEALQEELSRDGACCYECVMDEENE